MGTSQMSLKTSVNLITQQNIQNNYKGRVNKIDQNRWGSDKKQWIGPIIYFEGKGPIMTTKINNIHKIYVN